MHAAISHCSLCGVLFPPGCPGVEGSMVQSSWQSHFSLPVQQMVNWCMHGRPAMHAGG